MKMFRLPKSGALSVTTLLIVIVLAAVLLPMITSRLGMHAGFVDIGAPISVLNQGAIGESQSQFLPCRGVGGQPCPEGTFCDSGNPSLRAPPKCIPIAVAGI
jgi:hypothetical protein